MRQNGKNRVKNKQIGRLSSIHRKVCYKYCSNVVEVQPHGDLGSRVALDARATSEARGFRLSRLASTAQRGVSMKRELL
jgi:hypothetical protein